MFSTLKAYAGLIKIVCYIVGTLVTAHVYADYRVGKLEAVLLADNVQVLRDGKEIRDEIKTASDSELCAIFSGCELPEESTNSN